LLFGNQNNLPLTRADFLFNIVANNKKESAMGDYISEFNQKQAERAKVEALRIRNQVPEELRICLGEGSFASAVADLERCAILIFTEYSHWLASKLVRSKNFNRQNFPDSEQIIQYIGKKFGFSTALVTSFVLRIRLMKSMPLIGMIEGGYYLIPDEEALRDYEACFDLSEQPDPTS
jgi:hypothetical protein